MDPGLGCACSFIQNQNKKCTGHSDKCNIVMVRLLNIGIKKLEPFESPYFFNGGKKSFSVHILVLPKKTNGQI